MLPQGKHSTTHAENTNRLVILENGGNFRYSENDHCCRCCLAVGASIANLHLYSEINLINFTSCTNIQAEPGDGFPKYLCRGCSHKLHKFYKFLQMCKRSHENIKNTIELYKMEKLVDKTFECKVELTTASDTIQPVFKSECNNSGNDESYGNTKEIEYADPLDQQYDQPVTKHKKLQNKKTLSQQSNVNELVIPPKSRKLKDAKMNKTRKSIPSYVTCQMCKTLIRKSLLKRHLQVHDLKKPLYYCSICKKNFKCSSHSERHNENNFIVCQICGKSIFSKTYEIHIKRHNKQKDHTCNVCGQKFYQRSLLRHHELDRHMGRKFTCDYCKKDFITKFAIRTHIYRHSEIPRFKCDMCEKAYRSHWVLTLHKRTHTGVQPYKCDSCLRGFSNLSKMKRHRLSHSEERSFMCEHCCQTYKYKTSYRRHLERCKCRKEKFHTEND